MLGHTEKKSLQFRRESMNKRVPVHHQGKGGRGGQGTPVPRGCASPTPVTQNRVLVHHTVMHIVETGRTEISKKDYLKLLFVVFVKNVVEISLRFQKVEHVCC